MTITINTLLSSIYPKLAQEAMTSIKQLADRFVVVSLFILFVGGYFCICIALFSTEIVTFLYGDSYHNAADVMVYQSWYLVFNAIFCLIGYSLAAMKRDKGLATLSICFGAVNTPIFWYLSHYGAVMLSYGFVIGGIINMTYHIIYLNRAVNKQLGRYYYTRLFGCCVFGLVITYLCTSINNFITKGIIWGAFSITSICLFLYVMRKLMYIKNNK